MFIYDDLNLKVDLDGKNVVTMVLAKLEFLFVIFCLSSYKLSLLYTWLIKARKQIWDVLMMTI